MYKYDWDTESGGIILLNYQSNMVPEVRPVFHEEMKLLGFDKYWDFEASEAPYMWNDGEAYYYRGEKFVSFHPLKSSFEDYQINYLNEASLGMKLKPVDVDMMVRKNRFLTDSLVKSSMQCIYETYQRYRSSVDIICASYSGGKDSVVVLDLTKRILPRESFIVLNTDTGMEFSFTERAVEDEAEKCRDEGIEFYRARSEYDPKEMWKTIGPPARFNRWCCSVQKSVPLLLLIRKISGKDNCRVLSIVGNRANESELRSKYNHVEENTKFSMNIICNAISQWNSAEVFLYIFERKLMLNEGYRRGLKRIGCAVCPMAGVGGLKADIVAAEEECGPWIRLVADAYGESGNLSDSQVLASGEWKKRIGSPGTVYKSRYRDYYADGNYYIEYFDLSCDWKMWMKTIGILKEYTDSYRIDFRGKEYGFKVLNDKEKTQVLIEDVNVVKDEEFIKLFRTVFIKAVFCVGCRTCEVECTNGCMKMENGHVSISDDCRHCSKCHSNRHICNVYSSQYVPSDVII